MTKNHDGAATGKPVPDGRPAQRRPFRRRALSAVLAFSLLLLLAAPAFAADTAEVHAGSELDFRPYCFADKSGRPAGFGAELLGAVADKMGLRLQITPAPWDEVWNDLLTGRLDVLPVVARTAGREPLVDFSLPHTETFDAFFTRKGQPPLKDIAAAAGKEIVVLRSDAAHHQLSERNFLGKVIPVESIPEGLKLVAAGKHDAMLCSKLVGVLEREQAGIKEVKAGPPIPDYKRVFSFAVRKGDAELLEKLNQGLLIVKSDGTYDRIYRRWMTVEEPWHRWLPYFRWVVAGLVLLTGLVAALQWMVSRRTRQLCELNATLEQRVAERTAELARSNDDLQQFAYVASHDLQEPLRMVTAFLGLLKNRYGGQLDDHAREYIGFAVDGATRMSRLISDLLAYSRAGGRDVEPGPADMAAVVESVRGTLRAAIEESGVVVTADPLPTMTADAGQMGQLLQNLVGNAIKFRREGVRPEVRIAARREAGGWLFSVSDNGIGVEPGMSDKIFMIFQRAHGRDKYPGTGIGLAVCKKIVERHGGRIWVESPAGGGATFHFTIPDAPPAPATKTAAP